ncbi:hypothetical protein [Nocardioides sp. SLBN-35]|uniref:hypothetical protein n=1 Tax=Nocardioides sp. SLBN-35 TaxID=2768445 RepID=UPI00115074DE|nr:hypothetical protein [Nocardioides sp. SLBN-35]TQK71393.1 hypothetical protein FBY23_3186 [Nocardioides sp. SLBN-35]
MSRSPGRIRLVVLLLAGLLAASFGSSAVTPTATTVGVGLTVRADQTAVGVSVGAQAVVAVTVSQQGSLLGPVQLSVTGAPVGASVAILPNPVLLGVPAVIAITTTAATPAGSYALTIVATSGTHTASVTVTLVVSLPTGFTMTLSPPSATVVDGASATYTLSINRGLLAGPIGLSLTGVPQFATATVSPSLSVLGNTATIKVSTATNVVPGAYLITVKGKSLLASATASAYLVVLPQTYDDFPVGGTPDRTLAPGSEPAAIDLALTNPFDAPMTVTGLGVSITSTSVTGCGVDNYAVDDYTGPFPLTVPAHGTRTLSQLGVPRGQWPKVRMLDLPTNQDVCKGATVQLAYTGAGNGA